MHKEVQDELLKVLVADRDGVWEYTGCLNYNAYPIPCDNKEKFGTWTVGDYARKLDEEHGELQRAIGEWNLLQDEKEPLPYMVDVVKEACDALIASAGMAYRMECNTNRLRKGFIGCQEYLMEEANLEQCARKVATAHGVLNRNMTYKNVKYLWRSVISLLVYGLGLSVDAVSVALEVVNEDNARRGYRE